ncbi:MAG: hypothetical protein J5835_07270 [Bacteroidales bacterium]|nr:hypothetical protein [Bacteroidales bacterium]
MIQSATGVESALDLFFFDAHEPFLLDSYQHMNSGVSPLYGLSGTGEKLAVAISATSDDIYSRSHVRALGDLSSNHFNLSDEHPGKPLLFGWIYLKDGRSRAVTLTLKPQLCRIRVKSLCCDFRERPYPEVSFNNTKLFLMNAVSEYAPAVTAEGRPVSWDNLGVPSSESSFLTTDGAGTVGRNRVFPEDLSLYCYPNGTDTEMPGKPFTRLVLEGYVGDTHCYYPVNIPSMVPGGNYELDITIRRKGTSDPDIAAETDAVSALQTIIPWNETDERNQIF